MNNWKDYSPENIRDLKRTINKRNWAGLVIWKLKQAWGLGRIAAYVVSMCVSYVVFKLNIYSRKDLKLENCW